MKRTTLNNTNAVEMNFSNNVLTSKTANNLLNTKVNNMYNAINNTALVSALNQTELKNIVEGIGGIDWKKVEDKVAMLFHAGYSDAGNKIGIYTNVNALLQDMFVYCTLEEKKENLKKSIAGACENVVKGFRYLSNNSSPLFYTVPTKGIEGYTTCAIMVHKRHADKFMDIVSKLDVDVMTDEDFDVLAKDLSFLSRTQELAIDVAKDKTIEIVSTDEWLNQGVKPYMFHLNIDKKTGKIRSKNNLKEILKTIKEGNKASNFEVTSNVDEETQDKIKHQVLTSSCLSKNAINSAFVDFMNNDMLHVLNNSTITDQAKSIAAFGNSNAEIVKAILNVLSVYRELSYNIELSEDKDLRSIQKEELKKYANAARNTIYKICNSLGIKDELVIARLTWAADMRKQDVCNAVNEVGTFKEIMNEEFLALYSTDAKLTEIEDLFYVEEITEELVLDGNDITVTFVNGEAIDDCGSLIASCSYKFNGTATIEYREEIGKFVAVKNESIVIPEVGTELLFSLTKSVDLTGELTYHPTTPNNVNVFTKLNEAGQLSPVAVNENKNLTTIYKAMFVSDGILATIVTNKAFKLLNDGDKVREYKLRGTINVVDSTVVKDTTIVIVTVK